MLGQVLRDFEGAVGDFRRLSLREIRWFYEWLRPELHRATKPREKPKK